MLSIRMDELLRVSVLQTSELHYHTKEFDCLLRNSVSFTLVSSVAQGLRRCDTLWRSVPGSVEVTVNLVTFDMSMVVCFGLKGYTFGC
jgi:hypothetical protein